MIKNLEQLIEFENIINYIFQDKVLLDCALTHASYSKQKNYERLEFLGDSIINAVVAKLLYQNFPKKTEGDLTSIRSILVCGKSLSKLARKIKLNQFIKLGEQGLKSGLFNRNKILEDSFEALIGAIFLDSNFREVENWLLNNFCELKNLKLIKEEFIKNPKTELQNLLQKYGINLPVYQLLNKSGKDHSPIFKIKCIVKTMNLETKAEADNKKEAEQFAAEQMLIEIKNKICKKH